VSEYVSESVAAAYTAVLTAGARCQIKNDGCDYSVTCLIKSFGGIIQRETRL
jgi:hypothetical protein